MADNPKDIAESPLEKRRRRSQEGKKASTAYEAAGQAVREKTARLRALRLAKEAADLEAKTQQDLLAAAKKKPTARKKKAAP